MFSRGAASEGLRPELRLVALNSGDIVRIDRAVHGCVREDRCCPLAMATTSSRLQYCFQRTAGFYEVSQGFVDIRESRDLPSLDQVLDSLFIAHSHLWEFLRRR